MDSIEDEEKPNSRELQYKKNYFYFYVLFLQRAHSPDRPPLDSNPLPTDDKTRALANAPPGSKLDKRKADTSVAVAVLVRNLQIDVKQRNSK